MMPDGNSLEPRVTKVETELGSLSNNVQVLTRDVKDLAGVVRQQAENIETQMRQLTVAITSASGPRKTEWGVIVSAVGLVMAIGTAALSPLYLRMSDIQIAFNKIEARTEEHTKLEIHPVGKARLDNVESMLTRSAEINAREITKLDSKLQMETRLLDAALKERVLAIENSIAEERKRSLLVDERLAAELDKKCNELDERGASATRERLVAIETELKALSITATELRVKPTIESRLQIIENRLSEKRAGSEGTER